MAQGFAHLGKWRWGGAIDEKETVAQGLVAVYVSPHPLLIV